MNELDHLLAPVRDTDPTIPSVTGGPLLAYAHRQARRRRRVAGAGLALVLAGAGSGAAVLVEHRDGDRFSVQQAEQPAGALLAQLDLASGTLLQVRATAGGGSVLAVFESGPGNPDGWVSRMTWSPLADGPSMQAGAHRVFGFTKVPATGVTVTSNGTAHAAAIAALPGGGTFFAAEFPVGMTGTLPTYPVTATASTGQGQQQLGRLDSAVGLAAAHPLAHGDTPATLPPMQDVPKLAALDDRIWISADGWLCLGTERPDASLAASACYSPAQARNVFQAGLAAGHMQYYVYLPRTVLSATVTAPGQSTAVTAAVHTFTHGAVATFALAPGERHATLSARTSTGGSRTLAVP